ncbi:MAG: UvrD-helicase domain-containing protein [Abditibacteriales bacterium]|nr:UvrD-helicase domain-containing protein [Abditibacteriales bacterium]MDW8364954.1 UvrD-helicase domain-containing protein [Abditibacteriales bacterium]
MVTDAEARQIAIEDLDHHLFLSAGAGAGKTRVLVERYLHILRQQRAGVEEIVAVTFTEKAANEMKERLRQELTRLSSSIPNAQRHLRALERAPISTIHALCARILRENAIAAGIDPQFAVLDEVEARLLLEETLAGFVRSRLRADALTSNPSPAARGREETTMLTLVREWGLHKTASLLRDFVNDRERALACLDAMPSEKAELLAVWREAVAEEQKAALQNLLNDASWAESLSVLQQTQPRDPNDSAAVHRAHILDRAMKAADASLFTAERVQAVREILSHINLRAGQQKNWLSKDDLASVREAFKRLRLLCQAFAEQVGHENDTELDERAAEVSLAFAAELRHALAAYDRAKRERSVLDFADLQLYVRDLLRQRPDVRQSYQQRFKFIMVDEFQDTNALQKEIVWMLAGVRVRGYAGIRVEEHDAVTRMPEHSHTQRPASRLFIVGDIKQGIYRFRGADVSVFNQTAEEFKSDPQCRFLELSKNFRTQPPLVDFFNQVFSHPAVMGGSEGKALYEAAYAPMEAHRSDTAPTSCRQHVELLLVKQSNNDKRSTAELRPVEAHAIAQRITELVSAGANYGDIALLFAAMTDVATYENALRERRIPYYVVAGSGLYRQQEVKDVLSFLSVLENVHDDLALIGALRSPFFAVSDETLYWLCHPPRGRSLYEEILRFAQNDVAADRRPERSEEFHHHITAEERDKLRRVVHLLVALREVKNRLRLSQLINLILERTGFTAVLLTQFMGEQKVSNVRKLIDIARTFERKGNFTLQDFIAHIGEFVDIAQRESEAATQAEESNVVKLLTVHRAKGLEWPIVFVPDLARARRGGGGAVLMHPRCGFVAQVEDDGGQLALPSIGHRVRREENRMEVAEHRRLFYVAVTRARDRLILSSAFQLQKETWLQWLNEALGGLEETGQLGNGETSGRVAVRWFDPPADAHPSLSDTSPPPASSQLDVGATRVDEEQLRRQVQPVPVQFERKSCFAVAELCDYLWCPQKYFLAHGQQLPATDQCVDWSIGQSMYEELLRRAVGLITRQRSEDVEGIIRTCLRQQAIASDAALVAHLHHVLRRFLQSDLWRKLSGMNLQSNVNVHWTLDDAQVEGVIDLLGTDDGGLVHIAQLKAVNPRHPWEEIVHRFEVGLLCEAGRALSGRAVGSATIYYFEDGREGIVPLVPFPPRATEVITHIRRAAFGRRADAPCAACGHAWACLLRSRLTA